MNKFFRFCMIAVLAATALSCSDDDSNNNSDEGPYSALLCVGAWPNTAYYIANFKSLTEGEISLVGNGAELTGKVYAQDVIQRNGFYYHANAGTGKLGKYHVDNGALVTDVEIVLTSVDWSATSWVDDNTLAIFGTKDDEVRYAIVNVSTMEITKEGTLGVTALPEGFAQYMVSFAEYRANKFFVGFTMISGWENYPVMETYGSTLVSVVSYPAMTVDATLEDERSSTPGGPNVYAPTVFTDENNDIYFITDPVYAYDMESPSVVYRIKSGETTFDSEYFYNLSEDTEGGMGAAFWYIGDGKAIVRTRVAGESIDAEHSFSLINVHDGSFIKKLDLPADLGERMVQAVIVENGKAYIAVNGAEHDYIWEYDPATDELTEGAEFVGGVDYILRIEKTN